MPHQDHLRKYYKTDTTHACMSTLTWRLASVIDLDGFFLNDDIFSEEMIGSRVAVAGIITLFFLDHTEIHQQRTTMDTTVC